MVNRIIIGTSIDLNETKLLNTSVTGRSSLAVMKTIGAKTRTLKNLGQSMILTCPVFRTIGYFITVVLADVTIIKRVVKFCVFGGFTIGLDAKRWTA
jgi:hypothetical protein